MRRMDSRQEALIRRAYETYGHLVLRRCQLLLRDPDLAQDALQEVFMRVFKYSEKFKEVQAPIAWLYRVSTNVCFTMLSQNKRKKYQQEEDALTQDLMNSNVANAALGEKAILMKFLQEFDEKTRTVALLHLVDELPQERIGELTGWSRQTINKKLKKINQVVEAYQRKFQ